MNNVKDKFKQLKSYKNLIMIISVILVILLCFSVFFNYYQSGYVTNDTYRESNENNKHHYLVGQEALLFIQLMINREEDDEGISRNEDADFQKNSIGIVDILYNTASNKKMKLTIEQGGKKYVYNIESDEDYMSFPLQLGNGNYRVIIYENTSGSKYKKVYQEKGEVELINDQIVYLNSVQQIEWYNDDEAIKLTNELMAKHGDNKEVLSDEDKIQIIYNYIVENIGYDYKKVSELTYDYIPNIDKILEVNAGICYDYSVLFAAMLRSQGIHTKLIKGYSNSTDVYHAWNEVYIKDEDRWIVVDTTIDAYNYKRGKVYKLEKDRESYEMMYEY